MGNIGQLINFDVLEFFHFSCHKYHLFYYFNIQINIKGGIKNDEGINKHFHFDISVNITYFTHTKFIDYSFVIGMTATVIIWFSTSKAVSHHEIWI